MFIVTKMFKITKNVRELEFQGHSLLFIFFTSLFSRRGQILQSFFLDCLLRTDIPLQLSALRVYQKKTTTQFFILLNCCLYIYILNSSFNASCNNFLTFISFFFLQLYDIISSKEGRTVGTSSTLLGNIKDYLRFGLPPLAFFFCS